MQKTALKIFIALIFIFPTSTFGQVMYQLPEEDGFSFGSYGRVGVDWSLAHYNDAAKENMYSPYLQFVGKNSGVTILE